MRKTLFAAIAMPVVLVSAACGGQTPATNLEGEGPTSRESTTASTTPTTPAAASGGQGAAPAAPADAAASAAPADPADPQAAVLAAYHAYWGAEHAAYNNPDFTIGEMRPLIADDSESMIFSLMLPRLVSEKREGNYAYRPEVREFDGQRAVIVDCRDASNVRILNKEDGTEKRRPAKESETQTTLVNVAGTWLVSEANEIPSYHAALLKGCAQEGYGAL